MRTRFWLGMLLVAVACTEEEPLAPTPPAAPKTMARPSAAMGVVTGEIINLPGSPDYVVVNDINTAGVAVGEAVSFYSFTGSWSYPPADTSSQFRQMRAINAAGVRAGNTNESGVVIASDGTITTLAGLPGGPYPHTDVQDMNEAGEVVGWSTGGSDSWVHAVVWETPTSPPLELLPVTGPPSATMVNGIASGLSGSQRIAVGYSAANVGTSSSYVVPTAWMGTQPLELPGLPGVSNAGGVAWGAADNGMIVGSLPSATGQSQPVVWQNGALLADLTPICASLTPYPYGGAYDIALTPEGRVLIAGWCGGYDAVVFYSKGDGTFGGQLLGSNGEATAITSTGYVAGRSNNVAVRWTFTPPPENRPPTVVLADATAEEGSPILLQPASNDPDGDALSFTWDFGDGTSGNGPSPEHTYDDDGTYVVTVTASDGGLSASSSAMVVVNNVAPIATFVFPAASLQQDASFMLSMTAPLDPSTSDMNDLQYKFHCGDGWGPWGTTASATCTARSKPGDDVVKAGIRDRDGGVTIYDASITVNDPPPEVTLLAPDTIYVQAKTELTVSATFTDRSQDAPFTAKVHWGEGLGTTRLDDVVPGTPFTAMKKYKTPGIYTLMVEVKDTYNQWGETRITVVVQ